MTAANWRYDRVDNAEVLAAICTVNARILASTGAERERLQAEIAIFRADDPEWVASWIADGVFHMVPGPRLLELCVPMASLSLPPAYGASR